MTFGLMLLIALAVGSLALAIYSLITDRKRQELIERARNDSEQERSRQSALLVVGRRQADKARSELLKKLPAGFETSKYAEKLAWAGFESPAAPLVFNALRIAVLLVLPVLTLLVWPRSGMWMTLIVGWAMTMGAWVLPIALLERLIRSRQDRIRRALPDALDLLVVCVEAGVSIDAAVLRVAREMALPYPDLARELLVVNRKTNAGISREEAIRGLWIRTGVDELHMLSSSIIQTEKWGTSISKVLRVSAATFRRKRRQNAEKRISLAPVKMSIPLVTMILPALFIIILGPAVLQVMVSLSGVTK